MAPRRAAAPRLEQPEGGTEQTDATNVSTQHSAHPVPLTLVDDATATAGRRCLDEALNLAMHGYQLTPVVLRRRADGAKAPHFLPGGWRHEAAWSTDRHQILAWWADDQDTSFALRTGTAAGVDVIDLDVKGGIDAVTWWSRQGHPLGSVVVETPSGGLHSYVRACGLPTKAGQFAVGVDTRGDGGLVFAPGAHVVGEAGSYRVQGELVAVADLAPLAPELAHAIRSAAPAGKEYAADGAIVTKDHPWAIEKCQAALAVIAELPPRTGGSEFRDAQMGAAMMLGRLVEADAATHEWAVETLERATMTVWGTVSAADAANIASGLADGPRKERWRFRPEQDGDEPAPASTGTRQIRLRAASTFRIRATDWCWAGRMPLGALTLIAGREGDGKSTLSYEVLARLTRGELAGDFHGNARNVAVVATEDSWELTIVPRLMAAGADLDRVFHVEAVRPDGREGVVTLPVDLAETEAALIAENVAALLLDPLMSRLDGQLDTHKDADVRQALEPLVALAERARCAVLGLIHLNKTASTDPLQAVMASKAFVAVARSVLYVMRDPDDETRTRRSVGLVKSNLASEDVATQTFSIGSAVVGRDPDSGKDITAGRLTWGEEERRTIRDMLATVGDSSEDRGAETEARDWLDDWLQGSGGSAWSKDAKAAGRGEGHSERTLQRVVKRPLFAVSSEGKPRRTKWSLA